MFLRTQPANNTEINWDKYFTLYYSEILQFHANIKKDESIKGKSVKQYNLYHYYLGLIYTLLLHAEQSEGTNNTWDYYKSKYDIDTIDKALGCNNISLDRLFEIFGIKDNDNEGIPNLGIEVNLFLDTEAIVNKTDINTIRSNNLINLLQ